MNKFYRIIAFTLSCFFFIIACKKENQTLSLEQIKYNNNQATYASNRLDSTQVINKITKQKTQEVLDLATLYSSGNKDTEIDSAMYGQILGYFFKPDSTTLKNLFVELDSFKVKKSKIDQFSLYEKYFGKDTLNFAKFNVQYFDANNRNVGNKEHVAQYVLVPAEIQLKKEFKFFFLNFYDNPLKENDSLEVNK